jgi:hypothetical protein
LHVLDSFPGFIHSLGAEIMLDFVTNAILHAAAKRQVMAAALGWWR